MNVRVLYLSKDKIKEKWEEKMCWKQGFQIFIQNPLGGKEGALLKSTETRL